MRFISTLYTKNTILKDNIRIHITLTWFVWVFLCTELRKDMIVWNIPLNYKPESTLTTQSLIKFLQRRRVNICEGRSTLEWDTPNDLSRALPSFGTLVIPQSRRASPQIDPSPNHKPEKWHGQVAKTTNAGSVSRTNFHPSLPPPLFSQSDSL